MQVEECVRQRRSVRKYSDRTIEDSTLRGIIELVRFSPSWKNTQSVRYYVVKNDAVKSNIADNCVSGFEFNAKTINRCKALVIVTVVVGQSGCVDGIYSTSQGNGWEMFDAGISSQTFSLVAHEKGLGSVILGIFDENKIRQYIQIPDNERITNLIALGYPLEGSKTAPHRKEISELLTIID